MTTTAREDRNRPGAHRHAGAPRATHPRPSFGVDQLSSPASSRPLLGCLLAVWAWSATTHTEEVLAARDTIHRGDVIEADDIQRVRISGDPALRPLPASAYDESSVSGPHSTSRRADC
jgi:hypothetical protein